MTATLSLAMLHQMDAHWRAGMRRLDTLQQLRRSIAFRHASDLA